MEESLWFFGVATCVKLLLAPSYRSTDFEVHRHWLALTASLPLHRWYYDSSSPWTLDYPPLFAFFELLLSYLASLADPAITDIRSHSYSSTSAVLFLRLSVAAADLVLLYGARRLSRTLIPSCRRLALALVIWSPALLIVDHVHFQYNGYLLGILLLSLSFLAEGRDLSGGVAFAVLICSKHLFVVAAPVYFVYLLRHYCLGGALKGGMRFAAMGAAVGAVFAASFGPFLYHGQILQVLRRLFPFGRGLCHAYWAPNIWVFYIVIDKVLAFLMSKLGFAIQAPRASFTGGLVGDASPFAVLPQVTPLASFVLVFVAMSPSLIKAWSKPHPNNIVRYVAYACTCGFMFGWHVHEKASLHFLIPLGFVATNSLKDARHYFLLSIVSCYSMFPLLSQQQEYPTKALLLLTHLALMWAGFSSEFGPGVESSKKHKHGVSGCGATVNPVKKTPVGTIGALYLLGLLAVEIWGQFLHTWIFGDRFPFMPLMLVSIYCGVGMLYSWVWQLKQVLLCT